MLTIDKSGERREDLEYRKAVHAFMIKIARRRSEMDAEELDALCEMHRLQLWRDYGCATALEYLERVLGYTPHVASERLRVGAALLGLPKMKAALAVGQLCFSAVRELTRVADVATEAAWIAAAGTKNMRQIEDLVAHHSKGELPTDDPDPTPKRCKLRFDEVTPETLAMMRDARKHLEAELGARLDNDAFLQLLARRVMEPAQAEGTVTPPAYQIATIRKCLQCDRAWQNGAGVDLIVDDTVVERAACDAKLLGDLDALVPARITQTVTPRTRKQVFARDQFRCCVPGCRSSRGLDIHHIEPQSEGGSHEMCNLCLLCSGHHTLLHDGKLSLTGRAPDGIEVRWKQGIWWVSSHVGRETGNTVEPQWVPKEELEELARVVDKALAEMPDFRHGT